MGIVLSFLARLLFLIVGLINPIVVLVLKAKKHGFLKVVNTYFFNSAMDLDIYGNYTYRSTWRVLFSKKTGYNFGVKGETISSALGKKQKDGSLSIAGWAILYILWVIDYKYWKLGGHCFNSIMTLEEIRSYNGCN